MSGVQPAAELALLRRRRAPLVAGLAGAGAGGAGQGAGGGAFAGAHAPFIWLAAGGSGRAVGAAAAPAWTGTHRPGGAALVWPGAAGRGGAVLAELFWLPQSAALHRGGEQPPGSLVVLWAGAGDRQPAGHALVAAGAGPGPGAPALALAAGRAAGARALPAALRRLLAAGGVSVFHCGRHQAAQLLAAGHTGGGPARGPGCPAGPALGLGAEPAAHGGGGRGLRGRTPLAAAY